MRVFILAGGLGTRLRPAIGDRPKVLAGVAGHPFILYPILWCRRHGVLDIVLCVGYLGTEIEQVMGNGQTWGVRLSYSYEYEPLGTAGALRQVTENVKETFIVMNGDTYFDVDLPHFVASHYSMGGVATLALFQPRDGHLGGCVTMSAQGKIAGFVEKPDRGKPQFMNGGVYIFEPECLEDVTLGKRASLENEVFPSLAANGKLRGFVSQGFFADIGTPESLKLFEEAVLRGETHDRP